MEQTDQKRVFKIGFYASNVVDQLVVMVEIFENDKLYQERFKEILPEYMQNPIEYYLAHNINP